MPRRGAASLKIFIASYELESEIVSEDSLNNPFYFFIIFEPSFKIYPKSFLNFSSLR
jgi:hypothetical protein